MAQETEELSKADVIAKVESLGTLTEEQRNKIVCSLIGHSRIQKHFFGYFHCGRCGEFLGDNLAGIYGAANLVIIGHNCDTCRENYEQMDWRDTLFTPDPFETES